jgi:hypothetical protein
VERLDRYMATSALYERPQDPGVFDSAEAAQLAVEREALNLKLLRVAPERAGHRRAAAP